ncbi:MAG: hypothetical protein EPO23_00475 [Xanthobacteraceae bacterium]|nr:MAG: hypothetical protein EPO23_00475 [Xanthobacteraceae bacterium]
MPAYLLTAPAAEPLSLDDARRYLRVEHDDDDATIAALIAAARNHVEALTRRVLITQTWRFVRDDWPGDGRIRLRMGPLRGLSAARLIDAQGTAAALDAGLFVADRASNTLTASPWALPVPGRATAGIELDIALGFGPAPEDVPDMLRHAIRMLVAHWYENRGLVGIGQSVAMMPPTVAAMLTSFRAVSLC